MALTSEARVPIRTCVGCGRRAPQAELVRVALLDGVAVVDRHAPGRGAWLCGAGCLAAARKRRGFRRAWRADVGDDVLAGLEQRLAHRERAEKHGQRVAIGAPAARLADRRKVTLRRGEEVSGT